MAKVYIPRSVMILGSAVKYGIINEDSLVLIGAMSSKINLSTASNVRTYANNSRRIVEGPQTNEQISITTPILSREVFITINSWLGEAVLYKDATDQYVWGLLKSVNVNENAVRYDTDMQSMNLTIDQTTEFVPGRFA